ncbi:unnamed protein product [Rotaria sordida]|nr:unnamed protein product [Rotaria sordida]CAF1655972.1 unnamed protein product [Rotaria sordida]
MQQFFIDFFYIKNDENELFKSGDIIILDYRNNLICAKSPDNHQQIIFGRVIAFQDETINTQPINSRRKLIQIPKGSIAINRLTNDNHQEIKILPIGLIEGRTLARIWPLKRSTLHLLNMPTTLDI